MLRLNFVEITNGSPCRILVGPLCNYLLAPPSLHLRGQSPERCVSELDFLPREGTSF